MSFEPRASLRTTRCRQRCHLWVAFLAVLIFTMSCSTPAPQETDAPSATAEEDIAAIKELLAAHYEDIRSSDDAAIEAQHADGLVMIMSDFENRVTEGSPELERLKSTKGDRVPENIEVKLLASDVALVTFELKVSLTWPDGSVDNRTRSVTEIRVKQDGDWKELHYHASVYAPLTE